MNYTSLCRRDLWSFQMAFELIEDWETFVAAEDLEWSALFTRDGIEVRKYHRGCPMQLVGAYRPETFEQAEEREALERESLKLTWWKKMWKRLP